MPNVVWQCKTCWDTYPTEEAAVACEAKHPPVEALKITSVSYLPLLNRGGPRDIPQRVVVRWGTGFHDYGSYVLDHVGPRGV